MKFILCLISCLAVASLASAVPDIYPENGDASPTTEPFPEDEFGGIVRQRRNPMLEMIFKFFLQVIQSTFGVMPQFLSSDVVSQLVNMAAPQPLPSASTPGTDSIPEPPSLNGPAPPIDKTPEEEGNVEVPLPYRKPGKPTSVYNAYARGYKVSLKKPRSITLYRANIVERSCADYLRNIKKEKDQLKKKLMGLYCKRVSRK